jgi:N-acetylmuramoyl-L-alanine amidase
MPRARLLHVLAPAPAAVLLTAALAPGAPAIVAAPIPPPAVVCLDPGHGGNDPGAIGLYGLEEKVLTLDVATRLERLLQADGVSVAMTRTGDTNPSMQERSGTAIAAHADVYMSIHFNAWTDPSAEGSQVLYPYARDIPLAQAMDRALSAYLGPHGVHDGGLVLRNDWWLEPPMPTITAESLFITNPHDAALLLQPSFREGLAGAMRAGIEAFLPSIQERLHALEAAGEGPAPHTAGPASGAAGAPSAARTAPPAPLTPEGPSGAAPRAARSGGAPGILVASLWLALVGGAALAVRHRRRLLPALAEGAGQAGLLLRESGLRRRLLRRRRARLRRRAASGGMPRPGWDEWAGPTVEVQGRSVGARPPAATGQRKPGG